MVTIQKQLQIAEMQIETSRYNLLCWSFNNVGSFGSMNEFVSVLCNGGWGVVGRVDNLCLCFGRRRTDFPWSFSFVFILI